MSSREPETAAKVINWGFSCPSLHNNRVRMFRTKSSSVWESWAKSWMEMSFQADQLLLSNSFVKSCCIFNEWFLRVRMQSNLRDAEIFLSSSLEFSWRKDIKLLMASRWYSSKVFGSDLPELLLSSSWTSCLTVLKIQFPRMKWGLAWEASTEMAFWRILDWRFKKTLSDGVFSLLFPSNCSEYFESESRYFANKVKFLDCNLLQMSLWSWARISTFSFSDSKKNLLWRTSIAFLWSP